MNLPFHEASLTFARSASLMLPIMLLLAGTAGRVAAQDPPSKEALIKQMENYYVEMYSEPLRAQGRLPKLLAIMSLSKIQCDRTSGAVLELMSNKDRVVRYLAWEVLHARQTSLTPEQRLSWARSAAEMAAAGDFPGSTLAPPLRVLAAFAPDEVGKDRLKLINRVLENYDPSRDADKPVLDAARTLVRAWSDPAMIGRIKSKVSEDSSAAWYVIEPLAKSAAKEGAIETGADRRAAIDAWLRSDDARFDASRLLPYTDLGKRVPPGKVITDPNADEFRAELEIGKLNVDAIDVMWVIDSTGSMNGPNQIIAGQTAHFAAALGVLSDRVRFGATYYRHELDPKLQKECCGPAGQKPYYQVKVHPLTGNIAEIVSTMSKEPIPTPNRQLHRNMHPGCAVAGGIQGAIKAGMWIDESKGRRVMILVGDSNLTPDSEAATSALIKEATGRRFVVHAMLLNQAIKLWPDHIKTSGTKPTVLWKIGLKDDPTKPAPEAIRAFRGLEKSVILSTVSDNFHDRIDPLLTALSAYIDSVAER